MSPIRLCPDLEGGCETDTTTHMSFSKPPREAPRPASNTPHTRPPTQTHTPVWCVPVDLAPEPVGINDVPGAKGAMESVGGTVGKGVDAVDSGAKARLAFEAGLRNAGQVLREGENSA